MHHAPQDQPDRRSDFEPWEPDLVRRLVQNFISARRPPNDIEFEDLYQECLAHWWTQRDRYDEARGASRKTFLRKLVRRRLQDLARAWRAEKRGSGHLPVSLDLRRVAHEPDGRTIGEMLPSQESPEAHIAGALDLRQITSQLSERQREIIAGVTAGMTRTDLGRRLGISRDTIHEELRRIRQVFRDEGLADHLR